MKLRKTRAKGYIPKPPGNAETSIYRWFGYNNSDSCIELPALKIKA
jgi:hypothetical protein